ncbi:protein asteroid homolog 1 [Esox lucius]|uniref:Asteroid domain-containing protein n=1 Tax=Esox lucius TaxID=8010 RepID=A0A3P8ZEU5_ESOLU|nr:protein asteroid homolog 1 [Esox lucius]XP_010871648.3 protein asteroid homolog 1 [Esox lucius]XP_019905802.1 protein asteroid homolog 1 [Esox lucius]
MGVHGLTSYVEGNRGFFQEVKFRDSRLVIDGSSLFFKLYLNNGLDQAHGGDYDTFAALLSTFISALEACNVQPFVVLDGGMDPSDKKLSTLRQRMQSKIREAESLSRGQHGSVLPLLTRHVFIQVLSQRGVPLVQCPAEADWEIACLANQWACPVLTNDSDFYIFDLPGGYIPFQFFQWANVGGSSPNRYISARRYTVSGLCRHFGGMNRELLPLCAVLAGNDYTTEHTSKHINTLLSQLTAGAMGGGGGGGSQSRVRGILLWLSSFNGPEEALEVLGRLTGGVGGGRGGRTGLCAVLRSGMQEYHLTPPSRLSTWFSGGSSRSPQGLWDSTLCPPPEWLCWAAVSGAMAPLVLDVLGLKRVLLIPQVENSRQPSSHCCATAIRQALYGILLANQEAGNIREGQMGREEGHNVQGQGAQGTQGARGMARGGVQRGRRGRGGGQDQGVRWLDAEPCFGLGENNGPGGVERDTGLRVEEYDRHDLNLRKNQVEPRAPRTLLTLDTLCQAPVSVRLGVLYDVLGVKESSLAPLHPHLRLALGVTGFWRREARPLPTLPQIQALLLGIVYGEMTRNTQPGLKQKATERNIWVKIRLRPGNRRGVDLGVTHAFSQWQACLWSVLSLNQLLCMPLPEPDTAWLFSGTLVHGLVGRLRGGCSPESVLAADLFSLQLYRSLLAALESCTLNRLNSSSGMKRSGGRGRGRGKGRGGGRARGEKAPVSQEINNRFALLMAEEEEEDEE